MRPHRDTADVARYNEVARQIMQKHEIAIDDLYRFAVPQLSDIQRPVNVHFTPEGSKALGDKVTESIRSALDERMHQTRKSANSSTGD